MWRRWRVVPDAGRRPLLTGLLGFPWRESVIEARCAAFDPAGTSGRFEGRYHRAVPALGCTCGIYGSRTDLDSSNLARPPVGEPFVEGFVELSGRTIEHRSEVRAERASVVGPLVLRAGRPTLVNRISGGRPVSVRMAGDRYRTVWRSSGEPVLAVTLEPLRQGVAERYGCSVITGAV